MRDCEYCDLWEQSVARLESEVERLKGQLQHVEMSRDAAGNIISRLRSAGETFRLAVIESGALNQVSQDKYIDQLRAFEGELGHAWAKPEAARA